MKTLSTLFLFPALASVLVHARLHAVGFPCFNWKRKKLLEASGEGERRQVETLNYHSLMINAARHYTAKKYAMALANYRRVLAVRPDDTAALSGEAWSLYYLGQGEKAAEDFQTLLNLDANDSWAREGMALCEHRKNASRREPQKVSVSTAVCA